MLVLVLLLLLVVVVAVLLLLCARIQSSRGLSGTLDHAMSVSLLSLPVAHAHCLAAALAHVRVHSSCVPSSAVPMPALARAPPVRDS